MAAQFEAISRADFFELTRPLVGLRVSHVWLSHASSLMVEFGRLHPETIPFEKPITSLRGEVSLMLETNWRVERERSIAFGRGSTPKKLGFAIPQLKKRTVTGFTLEGSIPEIVLELDGKLRLRSFVSWENSGGWSLGLDSATLFPRPRKWMKIDHALWIHYQKGRLVREYDYDPADLK